MDDIVSWDELCDFAFFVLQLLDKATLFSKKEVLEEYEKHKNDKNFAKRVFEKAIYPNGDGLEFPNISKYTLDDLIYKKDIANADWYIMKEKFESKNQYYDDYEKNIDFVDYLMKNSYEAYKDYMDFESELMQEYEEYLRGFNLTVTDLIFGSEESKKIFRQVFFKKMYGKNFNSRKINEKTQPNHILIDANRSYEEVMEEIGDLVIESRNNSNEIKKEREIAIEDYNIIINIWNLVEMTNDSLSLENILKKTLKRY